MDTLPRRQLCTRPVLSVAATAIFQISAPKFHPIQTLTHSLIHSHTHTMQRAQRIVLNSLLLTISTSFICLLVLRWVEEDEELVSFF